MEKFFDLPIYRLPEDQYNAQLDKYVNHGVHRSPEESDSNQRNPDHKVRFEDYLWKQYGGQWLFNEIIGYVRLYFTGNQLRGELWKVDAKRIVRTRRKLILFNRPKIVPEVTIPYESSNEEIFQIVLDYVNKSRLELKGHYIDASMLENIGRHVNWSALLKSMW